MASFQTSQLQCAMNELSNHDHSRFLTRTNGTAGRVETHGSEAADYGVNFGIFREAVVVQMTWPGADAGVKVNDPQAYLRYITNGNVLSFDGEKQNGHLYNATDTSASKQLKEEQVRYQNMWYTLNRKMISSYDLLNKAVKDGNDNVDHDERQSNRTVFDNLVNKTGMCKFIEDKGKTSSDGYKEYSFESDSDDAGLKAVMANNEGKEYKADWKM